MKPARLTLLFLLILIIVSCQKDFKDSLDIFNKNELRETTSNGVVSDLLFKNNDGMTKLGLKKQNPYAVVTMKQALTSLQLLGLLKSTALKVRTTHYYVKFKPKNEEELWRLKFKRDINLFEYPLDYQILERGVYYRDPNVLENQPTYQYASVPLNYDFPNVEYEILSDLYIPEETEPQFVEDDVTMLVNQALKLTGNLDDVVVVNEISLKCSKWTPSGKILVFDTRRSQNIPVEGLVVKATRWFTTHKGVTNTNGDFSVNGDFCRPANYSFDWEHGQFDVRSGTFGQAGYNGPKIEAPWNLTINTGISSYYAHIYRAAYDYYTYYTRFGLSAPPLNSALRPKLKISAYDKDKEDENGQTHPFSRVFGAFSVIDIYNPNRRTDLIYGTTIHEVGHYAHWGFNSGDYNNAEDRVAESWSEGVEWLFGSWRYGTYGDIFTDGSNTVPGFQNRQMSTSPVYTSLFVDLNDDVNQSLTQGFFTLSCNNQGSFDGANCFISSVPSGTQAFIFANNLYYTPINGNQCPMAGSSYDGANCFVQSVPQNRVPFIFNNNFYLRPVGDTRFPNDHVFGYTPQQIEGALKGARSFDDWERNLRDNYNNFPSENYLYLLFDSWN